jgi:hypothetical protein
MQNPQTGRRLARRRMPICCGYCPASVFMQIPKRRSAQDHSADMRERKWERSVEKPSDPRPRRHQERPTRKLDKCAKAAARVKSPENNLRTKPPKHRAIPTQKTQEKARKQRTATHLEKSTGWRFESSPVHQLLSFQQVKLLLRPTCSQLGNIW